MEPGVFVRRSCLVKELLRILANRIEPAMIGTRVEVASDGSVGRWEWGDAKNKYIIFTTTATIESFGSVQMR